MAAQNKNVPSDKVVIARYNQYVEPRLTPELAYKGINFVEQGTKTYKACCPLHDDSHPSLEVHVQKDGNYLSWICRVCNVGGGPLQLLTRTTNLNLYEATLELAKSAGVDEALIQNGSKHKGKLLNKIVHIYRDKDGNKYSRVTKLIYEHKKVYPQEYWDGKEWLKGRPVKLIPYNLDEVVKNKEIFIAEGEKDCDNLAKFGLCSSTNPMGAGKWDGGDLNFWFKDKDVYIFVDNDEPGIRHGVGVALELTKVTRNVYLVPPFGEKEKYDVSDWLNDGGDLDQLWDIIDEVDRFNKNKIPDWAIFEQDKTLLKPIPEEIRDVTSSQQSHVVTAGDVKRYAEKYDDVELGSFRQIYEQYGEVTWSWENWIPNNLLTMMVADAGTGKTLACLDLARRFIHGGTWPDGSPVEKTGDVLWIEAEGMQGVNAQRAMSMGILDNLKVLTFDDEVGPDVLLDDQHMWEKFVAAANNDSIVAVFIDSLSGAHSGDENATSVMKPLLSKLASLVKYYKPKPFIITHHIRKKQDDSESRNIISSLDQVRGSSAIKQFFRVVIALDKPEAAHQEKIRFRQLKNNMVAIPSALGVLLGGEEIITYTSDVPVPDATVSQVKELMDKITDMLEYEDWDSNKLEDKLVQEGATKSKVRKAKEKLKDKGIIKHRKTSDDKWIVYLATTPVEDEKEVEEEPEGNQEKINWDDKNKRPF